MKPNKSKRSSRLEKKGKMKKKKKKSIISVLLRIVLIIFILITIVFCAITYKNGWGTRGALMTLLNINAKEVENLENINIVLLGISEDLDSKLTDTIMLCSYNPKTSSISLLSIPRDTFVGTLNESASGSDKINTIFYKNKEKLLNKISEIVGFKIKYYVVVNNKAIIEIIDIIGGVNFNVPIDMNYDDPTQDLHIHLTKGEQLIDGRKAEQLLRFRHNNDGTSYPNEYGDNDFGRMRTQRAFIEASMQQILKFRNIINYKKVYNTIMNNIETNYSIENIKKYIPTLVDFRLENINSKQIPGKSVKYNDIWFFIPNENKVKEIIKELEIN